MIPCQNRRMGCMFQANSQQDLTVHLYTCIPNLIESLQTQNTRLRQLHQDKDEYIRATGFGIPLNLAVDLDPTSELPAGGAAAPIPLSARGTSNAPMPSPRTSMQGLSPISRPVTSTQSPSLKPAPSDSQPIYASMPPKGNTPTPLLKRPTLSGTSSPKIEQKVIQIDAPKSEDLTTSEMSSSGSIYASLNSISSLNTKASSGPASPPPKLTPAQELDQLYSDKNWYCPNIYQRPESESLLSQSGHAQSFMIRMSGSVEGAQVISRYINNLNQYSHNIILPTEGGFQLHDKEMDPNIYNTIGEIANYSPCLEGFVPYFLSPSDGVRFIQLVNELRSKNIPIPKPPIKMPTLAAKPAVNAVKPSTSTLSNSQKNDPHYDYPLDTVVYENASEWDEVDIEEVKKKIEPIMKEIIQTERDYVTDLNILFYYEPMNKLAAKIASREDIDRLFSNLLELTQISKDILVSFEKAKKEGKGMIQPAAFSRSLLENIGPLQAYGKYCSSYHRWITVGELLTKLKSNNNFTVLEEEALKVIPDPKKKLPLESFLIKPVQRLTKYPLFFQQILKEMKGVPELEEDVQVIEEGQEKINELVSQVNRETKELETEVRTQTLLTNLEGDAPDLIGQKVAAECLGDVTTSTKTLKKGEKIKVVLFKEMLLYAKVIKTKLKFKGTIDLEKLRLVDIADSAEKKNVLSIEDRTGGEPIEISATSFMEKKQFLEQFMSLQKLLYQKSNSKRTITASLSKATAASVNPNSPMQDHKRQSLPFSSSAPTIPTKDPNKESPTASESGESLDENFGVTLDEDDNNSVSSGPARRPSRPPMRPPPSKPSSPMQGFSYFGATPSYKPVLKTGSGPASPVLKPNPAKPTNLGSNPVPIKRTGTVGLKPMGLKPSGN